MKYKNAPVEDKAGLVTGGESRRRQRSCMFIQKLCYFFGNMNGAALTVMRLDDELKEPLDYEVR